jgi:2-methylcitrate dehydratase PrpD
MVSAGTTPLPEAAMLACKHRILDTFGAMVSGARMRPGQMAAKYVRGLGGEPQASVIGTSFRTTTVNAALANAMCAHSDETDDFEPVTRRIRAARWCPRHSQWASIRVKAVRR